jgi:hypothetical protein
VRLLDAGPSERTGHKTGKREAMLTSHYSVQRYVRTPQAMAEVLLAGGDAGQPSAVPIARPLPVGKETRATLDGKDAALARLQTRIQARDGPHIQDRVALTDGAGALQERLAAALPGFTLVLDIMHVLSYLWPAAQATHDGWSSPPYPPTAARPWPTPSATSATTPPSCTTTSIWHAAGPSPAGSSRAPASMSCETAWSAPA